MKKNVVHFVLCSFVVLMFSSCLGPILGKADVSLANTATVRVSVEDASGASSSLSSSRVVAPAPLASSEWDSLHVTILKGSDIVVEDTVITAGTSVEFPDLEIGTEYTFSAKLLNSGSEVANGSINVTPVAGSNSVSIPVKRVRGTGTGSFQMTITLKDGESVIDWSLLTNVSAELYEFVEEGLVPVNAPPVSPWKWVSSTGVFTINWQDLDAGSYLLSVIASGEPDSVLGETRLLLGDDSLVEIYAGKESSATIECNSAAFLDSAVRYYVTQSGGQDQGHLPSEPIAFETAYAAILSNPLVSETRPGRIVLLENVDINDGYGNALPLNTFLHISGITGSEVVSCSVFETDSDAIFVIGEDLGNNTWKPGFLTLENVIVSGVSYRVGDDYPSRLVSVHSGTLTLGSGSVITGSNICPGISLGDTSLGDTSSIPDPLPRVDLAGGSIIECTAGLGAAISSNNGYGEIILRSGTINGCSAEIGGGIYVGSGATVDLLGSESVVFSGNTASVTGGAIAVAYDAGTELSPIPFADLQARCTFTLNVASVAFPNLARYYNINTTEHSLATVVSKNSTIPLFVNLFSDIIDLDSTILVTGSVFIRSDPLVMAYVPTITRLDNFFATDSTFTVSGSEANLTFFNVGLYMPESDAHLHTSYISIQGGATCSLKGGSTVSGLMTGNDVGVNGLAVNVGTGSTLNIDGARIYDCLNQLGDGGAIYVAENAFLNISGEYTELSFNYGANGGAIYTLSPVNFITEGLSNAFIHDNTAYDSSGGLHDAQVSKSVKINGVLGTNFAAVEQFFSSNTALNHSDSNWYE